MTRRTIWLLMGPYKLQIVKVTNFSVTKGFVTIVIENALKVISLSRRNYFT